MGLTGNYGNGKIAVVQCNNVGGWCKLGSNSKSFLISGFVGKSASRDVFLGFAPSNVLARISFSDVLDEETGAGYQRRFSPQHSLDFRRYVQLHGSSTIPLTFNLRPSSDTDWTIQEAASGYAKLKIRKDATKVLAQVDCQHRLGHLADLDISLPFMAFIGLSIRDEMEVFKVINSKAKGLSTSLLDFHEAQLASDLAIERPELFVALHLNDDVESPWYKQLDLGGNKTSGMTRRASLRTMQKAIKRFLHQTKILGAIAPTEVAIIIREFWCAISIVLDEEWKNPRSNFVTKGIGVYALMGIAGDLFLDSQHRGITCDRPYFSGNLEDFVHDVDWTKHGDFKGLGGESGAQAALEILRSVRRKDLFRVVQHG